MIRQAYMAEEVDEVLKTNDGSTIFENGNKFTIAVLTEIDEEGIAPLNKVAGNIKRILIQKKKADLLKKNWHRLRAVVKVYFPLPGKPVWKSKKPTKFHSILSKFREQESNLK